MFIKSKIYFLLILTISITIFPQTKRAINVDDLWALKRIGAYSVSPNGKTIAYTLTSYTFEANKGNTDIYLIDVDGKNSRVLKNSDKNESEPKFSPDGKTIAFTREGQIWQCNLDGSNEKQLTNIYSGASDFEWSADGKKYYLFLLFIQSAQHRNATNKRIRPKKKAK
jgi:Tol biopolymer transport system component